MFFMLKAREGGAGWVVSSANPADISAIATIPASNLREPNIFLGYILYSCQNDGWGSETFLISGLGIVFYGVKPSAGAGFSLLG
jgi:hypothetical protein